MRGLGQGSSILMSLSMIFIKNQQRTIGVDVKRIKKTAESILAFLNIPNHELSILLLDNKGITEINKKYLSRNRPTNVISFALNEGEFGNINPHVLGDVVISVEKAQEQAKIKGKTLEEEISFLLIHGILHLLGYDHVKGKRERERMREKEKEVYRFVMQKELL
jgi:probable rRNA maturation factor